MPRQTPTSADALAPQDCKMLSGEANIDSIRALEGQIREHERAIIKLKRARNSLLNISRLPPEVLGDIFCRNVPTEFPVEKSHKRLHNFLLVCHHWFEVASCTPEVWSFWGTKLQDWKERHLRYPLVPIDLMLDGGGTLDESLRSALQVRAVRGMIRSVCLTSTDLDLLRSIISSLTPNHEEIRSSNVQSVVLINAREDTSSIDVSDFFAYRHFPKLRRLDLDNCALSSWDFMSRTPVLKILSLGFIPPPLPPTMPQILSMLGSNPTLQEITLCLDTPPDSGGWESSLVSLPNLRMLNLAGDSEPVFRLLPLLDYPKTIDRLHIFLANCTPQAISDAVGPYLRAYLLRRGRSHGFGLYLSSEDCIEFAIANVGETDISPPGLQEMDNFIEITIQPDLGYSRDQLEEITLDLIAYVPREGVIYLRVDRDPAAMKTISSRLPYLRAIHFEGTSIDFAFPQPPPDGNMDIFPSLQHVTLDRVVVKRGKWDSLVTFLTHRASCGNRLDTLQLIGFHRVGRVPQTIKGLVREYRHRTD